MRNLLTNLPSLCGVCNRVFDKGHYCLPTDPSIIKVVGTSTVKEYKYGAR